MQYRLRLWDAHERPWILDTRPAVALSVFRCGEVAPSVLRVGVDAQRQEAAGGGSARERRGDAAPRFEKYSASLRHMRAAGSL